MFENILNGPREWIQFFVYPTEMEVGQSAPFDVELELDEMFYDESKIVLFNCSIPSHFNWMFFITGYINFGGGYKIEIYSRAWSV